MESDFITRPGLFATNKVKPPNLTGCWDFNHPKNWNVTYFLTSCILKIADNSGHWLLSSVRMSVSVSLWSTWNKTRRIRVPQRQNPYTRKEFYSNPASWSVPILTLLQWFIAFIITITINRSSTTVLGVRKSLEPHTGAPDKSFKTRRQQSPQASPVNTSWKISAGNESTTSGRSRSGTREDETRPWTKTGGWGHAAKC